MPSSRLRPSRRTSFARRDSNLALLGAVFSGVVLAFALVLLIVQRVNPEVGSQMRGATADALAPVLSVARAPVEAVRSIGTFFSEHSQVVERNRQLEAKLKANAEQVAKAKLLQHDLQQMEKLIGLRRPERRLVASAVASASSANAGQRMAIISAGLNDGVRPRMPVIAADGLAGRVSDVGRNASRILLLTDGTSRVPVRVQRTGWTGMAVGTGGTLLEFQFDTATATEKLRVGDRLITTGDGGLFPPGIPVAVITKAGSSPALARPSANPTGLGAVMIEAPWLPNPAFVAAADARPEADLPVSAQKPIVLPGAAPAVAANGTVGTMPATTATAPTAPAPLAGNQARPNPVAQPAGTPNAARPQPGIADAFSPPQPQPRATAQTPVAAPRP